jgi:lipopolysaccharide transport system permease protein
MTPLNPENNDWNIVIDADKKNSAVSFKEVQKFRDLIFLFVKRDFISIYKQTVLGPLWVIIQPVLTTITFTIIFGKIANIDTGKNIPPVLFYMIGVTTWAYFSDCVSKTSETFIANQNIFGKVYFPRIIVPLSIILTNLIKFGVQFTLFLAFYLYFYSFSEFSFSPSWTILLVPLLVINMALLGLGIGLIITSLTTKYRDLKFLIQFGIQLLMYATPIVYPLNGVNISSKYRFILQLNPMTNIIEGFKVGFFGTNEGIISIYTIGYSTIFAVVVFFVGVRIFGKMEKTFMDTI